MINTFVATASAGLVWMIVERIFGHKPSALGFASGLVVGLVAVHSSWDAYHLKATAKMRITKKDLREAIARGRNFLGMSREYYPPGAKYDFFQKMFHWGLIILGSFLLLSGLLTWEAITWQGVPLFVWLDRINHPFMDSFMRTGR